MNRLGLIETTDLRGSTAPTAASLLARDSTIPADINDVDALHPRANPLLSDQTRRNFLILATRSIVMSPAATYAHMALCGSEPARIAPHQPNRSAAC